MRHTNSDVPFNAAGQFLCVDQELLTQTRKVETHNVRAERILLLDSEYGTKHLS